jgi:hypothetical protein
VAPAPVGAKQSPSPPLSRGQLLAAKVAQPCAEHNRIPPIVSLGPSAALLAVYWLCLAILRRCRGSPGEAPPPREAFLAGSAARSTRDSASPSGPAGRR